MDESTWGQQPDESRSSRPGALRPKDARKWLGIGEKQLTELTKSGQIPHMRLGPKTILYPVAELERWLATRAMEGVSQ